MSEIENHSRDPLQSWGSFSLGTSPTFSEESPKWSAIFLNRFHAIRRLCSILHNRCSPLLSMGLISTRSSVGGIFRISIVPRFSLLLGVFLGSQKDCFTIASVIPERLVPAFYCYCLEAKNCFTICVPSLRHRLNVAVFPLFLWKRIKIEAIE